ncbi:MAG: L,D-transpeptidase family protein [Actinobacteria bacterium]|nr:L,D-transpeptidase family protein [Actinomycetota bacterium]
MAGISRRGFTVGAAGAAGLLLLDACSRKTRSAGSTGGAGAAAEQSSSATPTPTTSAPPPPVTLTVSPADGTGSVNPASIITVTATNGTVGDVSVQSSSGAAIAGALSADKKTWTATQQLGYSHTYTVTATAANEAGSPASATAKFTTLTPGNMTMPYLNTRGGGSLQNGAKYGVGFVIRVHFDERITDKAAAEKALVVTTAPTQVVGGWFWLDAQNVLWRPQAYFPAGTTVTVNANMLGVQVGPNLFGQDNAAATFTIGDKHVSVADDNTHMVNVYFNDQLVRQMPTSMGRGGYLDGTDGTISLYTPSGTYTVLDQANPVLMDSSTFGLPTTSRFGYKEYIAWATRISTDGIYLHELDSTVWAQGKQDTSHGCLNLNKSNAMWFYQNAMIGDVVTVQNTGGAPLAQWQNGDWSLSWDQWVAGSALHA